MEQEKHFNARPGNTNGTGNKSNRGRPQTERQRIASQFNFLLRCTKGANGSISHFGSLALNDAYRTGDYNKEKLDTVVTSWNVACDALEDLEKKIKALRE